MDVTIKLDPTHREWCVLEPVDFRMEKVSVNKDNLYTRWETGKKCKCKLAIAYSNIEQDPTKPGTLNIHWCKGEGHGDIDSIHWTVNVWDFTVANDAVRQFMLSLPEWIQPNAKDW